MYFNDIVGCYSGNFQNGTRFNFGQNCNNLFYGSIDDVIFYSLLF